MVSRIAIGTSDPERTRRVYDVAMSVLKDTAPYVRNPTGDKWQARWHHRPAN